MKSKFISFTTFLFIMISAVLFSLVIILFNNLSGSIDVLMTNAKTPHFMQMHSGKIDMTRLERFANESALVEKFQVMRFVNFEVGDAHVNDQIFEGGLQDNGVVKQGEYFDFLTDFDGKVIVPKPGEIYAPINYMKDQSIHVGDRFDLYGQQFIVKGFLRDSQMNSPLSSSKRFLIHESDFEKIQPKGKTEYLIEFRLKDIQTIGDFEANYNRMGLESNGPTLTYPLFEMINGLSDGLMIAIILLMSILVVFISFLCIRFTLLARLEDEYREIGVLKAVGLYDKDIIKLYIAKYTLIAFVGSLSGYSLSLFLKEILLEDIRLYMGVQDQKGIDGLLGILGAMVIGLIIIAYVHHILKKIKKVSVMEAIRYGDVQEQSPSYQKFLLSKSNLLTSNAFLGVKDILGRKKMYFTLVSVLLLSIFIMTVPINLYHTIASEHFISYMGVGEYDIRIDIQQTDQILEKVRQLQKEMDENKQVLKYSALTTRAYSVVALDGQEEKIKIEIGDHSVFPLTYAMGTMPTKENEIALSSIQADAMQKSIGDKISILKDGQAVELVISGIYSDITNGGKTAKAVFKDTNEEVMWSVIGIQVDDQTKIDATIRDYTKRFPYAKISGIDTYVQMTFGTTIQSLKKASVVGIFVAIFIMLFVTSLFVRMLVAKDRLSIAIMKSIGYRNQDIRGQYMIKTLLVGLFSTLIGTAMSILIGEKVAGMMIASFGVSSFAFDIHWGFMYIVSPLFVLATISLATRYNTHSIKTINIAQSIKE